MGTRRQLSFASFAEVAAEASRLHEVGYEKTGNWDLAQICGHLTRWVSYPMDGFPPLPLWLKPMFFVMRHTIAKKYKTMIFAKDGGEMKGSMATAPQSIPEPGGDEHQAVAELAAIYERWQHYTGPIQPSPLFGPLTHEELTTGHLRHAAHHLGFLVPKAG
jgi:hypothetical protein